MRRKTLFGIPKIPGEKKPPQARSGTGSRTGLVCLFSISPPPAKGVFCLKSAFEISIIKSWECGRIKTRKVLVT